MTKAGHNHQTANSIKGVVYCPACRKEKSVAYHNSHGKVSTRCARCKSLILIDCDKLAAEIIEPLKSQSLALYTANCKKD